jgi:hypothetical protein
MVNHIFIRETGEETFAWLGVSKLGREKIP